MTACLALTACTTTPPKVVTVVETRMIPVPESLTKPCQVYRAQAQMIGEAVKGHNLNVAYLEECNARLEQIRRLGEKQK